MLAKSIQSLLRRAELAQRTTFSIILGSCIALAVPVLSVLLGAILSALIRATASSLDVAERTPLATLLPDISQWLPSAMSPLTKVTVLLAIGLGYVLLNGILLYIFYRQIHGTAVLFEVNLIRQLRSHGKRLATVRTLSAQKQALTDGLNYQLPRVRSTLTHWWRTMPRHIVQLVLCVLVALLIQPLLAILTLIATSMVVLIYRFLDKNRRAALPIVRERAAQQRETLVDLSLNGPLLESVHDEQEVERRFSEQLSHYKRDATKSLASSAWKTPTVVLCCGVLGCLFLFVLAVQLLRDGASFTVPAALSFTLCCIGSAISLVRIQRVVRSARAVETSAESLEKFLALPVDEYDNDNLTTVDGIKEQAELEHVTVQDSRGRKLLENVSATFKPGQLIGVVASQAVQGRALVELLMGFGRPVSGRMLVDGKIVTDIQPESLTQCAHWVAADGAIVTGSVQDNLLSTSGAANRNGSLDLKETIRMTKLEETVQSLPDGLTTVISPNDDRLVGDSTFRMALARAALSGASVFVIEEPAGGYDPQTEEATLAALQSLVGHSNITVVLPQRLSTLRQCDVIIMMDDHQVADSGTHSELIQRNEFYRHLNYLKFNPFRN